MSKVDFICCEQMVVHLMPITVIMGEVSLLRLICNDPCRLIVYSLNYQKCSLKFIYNYRRFSDLKYMFQKSYELKNIQNKRDQKLFQLIFSLHHKTSVEWDFYHLYFVVKRLSRIFIFCIIFCNISTKYNYCFFRIASLTFWYTINSLSFNWVFVLIIYCCLQSYLFMITEFIKILYHENYF